jgi:hypothetical protein
LQESSIALHPSAQTPLMQNPAQQGTESLQPMNPI